MTQTEKALQLIDLCARLPHNTKIAYCTPDKTEVVTLSLATIKIIEAIPIYTDFPISVKSYLRPMSSMTEEEKKELSDITGGKFTYVYGILSNSYQNKDDGEWHNKCFRYVTLESIILVIDWLNKHHFDYRGLIEKGLALEAPEGIYE